MKKFRINIKWVLGALLGAGVLAGVYIFSGRLFAYYRDRAPEFPESAVTSPAYAAEVGDEVKAAFTAMIPEHRKIISAQLQSDSGSAVGGEVSFHRRNWRWHRGKWHFAGTFRGVREGKFQPGKIVVELSPCRNGSRNEFFTVPLPLVNFTLDPAINGDQELLLAETAESLPPEAGSGKARWFYWGVPIFLLLLLAVFLFFWWRRHPDEKLLTPWERAELALENLQISLVNRELTAAAAMVKLSDIVRRYLQERYEMPVLAATTAEFLSGCGESELIPTGEKSFLAECLQAADMVKFARGDAVTNSVELTINRAAALIARTKPHTEESKGA